jgi:hypothetical protein
MLSVSEIFNWLLLSYRLLFDTSELPAAEHACASEVPYQLIDNYQHYFKKSQSLYVFICYLLLYMAQTDACANNNFLF